MPRRPTALTFVDRHGLWTDEQAKAAAAVALEIKKRKLELVVKTAEAIWGTV